MCNRAERGQTDKVLRLFGARLGAAFNDGPLVVHPKEPGSVLRLVDGQLVLEQMTWGFPVALASKRDPKVKNKPKPVNNARFDKLGSFWKRWAENPVQRCLIPTVRYAEAVGERGKLDCMARHGHAVHRLQSAFARGGNAPAADHQEIGAVGAERGGQRLHLVEDMGVERADEALLGAEAQDQQPPRLAAIGSGFGPAGPIERQSLRNRGADRLGIFADAGKPRIGLAAAHRGDTAHGRDHRGELADAVDPVLDVAQPFSHDRFR